MKNTLFVLSCLALFFAIASVSAGSFMVGGSPVRSLTTDISTKDTVFYKVEYAFDKFQDVMFPIVSISGFDENTKNVHLVALAVAFRTSGAGLYAQGNIGAGFVSGADLPFSSNTRFALGAFLGWRNKDSNVRIGWEHISGNSSLIDTFILNKAENFLMLSMQTPLIIKW